METLVCLSGHWHFYKVETSCRISHNLGWSDASLWVVSRYQFPGRNILYEKSCPLRSVDTWCLHFAPFLPQDHLRKVVFTRVLQCMWWFNKLWNILPSDFEGPGRVLDQRLNWFFELPVERKCEGEEVRGEEEEWAGNLAPLSSRASLLWLLRCVFFGKRGSTAKINKKQIF